MNNLSLFLYFAEVISNLSFVGGTIIALLIVSTIVRVVATANNNDNANFPASYPRAVRKPYDFLMKPFIWGLIIAILLVFIPSKETMYLIAGSEAGEMVVTSTEGKEILGDIKDVIRSQLNNLKTNDE